MPTTPSRLIQLDILRCLAIFLVLGAHFPGLETVLPIYVQKDFIPIWTGCGWIGVDLFFVLSGFLISGLLFREYQTHGRINLSRFLVRRGFRIYPPYWFLLAFTVYVQVTNWTWGTPAANYYTLFHNLLFVQNYLPGFMFYLWSLAVEEHFYIVLPLALMLAYRFAPDPKNPYRWLPLVALGLTIIAIILRLITANYCGSYDAYKNYAPTHLRYDSLLFGVVISYYYHFYQPIFYLIFRRFWWLFSLLGLALIYPECHYNLDSSPFVYTYGFTFLYCGFGSLMCVLLVFQFPEWGPLKYFFRVIAYIGSHSYSIYLWHLPMKIWGPMYSTRWFGFTETPLRTFFIYLLGSIIIGILLSIIIEVPSRLIRDWLFPSRSPNLDPLKGKK